MKRIEDIENMEPGALERLALEQSIQVPEGLQDNVRSAIAAAAVEERKSLRLLPYAIPAAAAIAVAILIAATARPLRDTYDDPYMAYAQVEDAFRQISARMSSGVEAAGLTATTMEKPIEIYRKTNAQ